MLESGRVALPPIAVLGLATNPHTTAMLDRIGCKNIPGGCFLACLTAELVARGLEVQLLNDYLLSREKNEEHPRRAGLIGFGDHLIPESLENIGLEGLVLVNLESPIFVPDFFLDFAKISQGFKHAWVLGAKELQPVTKIPLRQAFFPSFSEEERRSTVTSNSSQRGYQSLTCMVSSQKYWRATGRARPKQLAKLLVSASFRNKYKFLKAIQLHDLRLHLISSLSRKSLIGLYGEGWSRASNPRKYRYPIDHKKLSPSALSPGPGIKRDTLQHYRFNLVVENCRFPGYITEKIFDAFLAGCVPVYWGAPDVTDFIPAECFVDGFQFKTMRALEKRLLSMSEEEWEGYRSAARAFLDSVGGSQFTYEKAAQEIADLVAHELVSPEAHETS